MRKIDNIIESIVYMIFNAEVDLDDPTETIEQIKAKLNSTGAYSYEKDKKEDKATYKWELMHGDGDHYEKKRLVLKNKKEICFFDYVISLPFNYEDCIGLNDIDDERKEVLYEYFKETNWYNENNCKDEIMDKITDVLQRIGYIEGDITCDRWHYAKIEYIEKK